MAVRFQILSDLHIDSYARRGLPMGDIPATDCDAILVAGDTANSDFGIAWLVQQSERLGKPLFFITGNHEYFGEDVTIFDKKIAANLNAHLNAQKNAQQNINNKTITAGTQVTFLQQQYVDFMGIRLFGCTLWTDYQYQANAETLTNALAFMQDYRSIGYQNRLFCPENSVKLHWQQRDWLQAGLIQAHTEGLASVVMSHHSISPSSISEKYAQMSSNAGFVSDFSEWLTQPWSPKLWVHGHTHEAFDYIQGNTRVVVNPRAYPGEVSSTGRVFDWEKVVTLV